MTEMKRSDSISYDPVTGEDWPSSVPPAIADLSKINGHLEDFIQAELRKLAQAVLDRAKAGEIVGAFQITIGPAGQIEYSTCLVRPSEALGMMEIAKEAILKKFVI